MSSNILTSLIITGMSIKLKKKSKSDHCVIVITFNIKFNLVLTYPSIIITIISQLKQNL